MCYNALMDKSQERLIDLATSAYRNYVSGDAPTTEGLVASTILMPVVIRALAALGPDFYFARYECLDWDDKANGFLQHRAQGLKKRVEQLDIDTDSINQLGAAYETYNTPPNERRLVHKQDVLAVQQITPLLTRTLYQMGPKMRLMSKALSDMMQTIAPLGNEDLDLENDPIGL